MDGYLTRDGRTIPFRTIGRRYVDQYMAQYQVPGPPTYEATTVAGDVEVHNHDELSARQTPGGWPLWIDYLRRRAEAIATRHQSAVEFLTWNVIALDPTPVEEWEHAVDFDLFGMTQPDPADKLAFKVFWLENELLPDPDDLAGCMAQLYAIGGIIENDQVTAFETFFRSALARLAFGRAGRAAASGSEDRGS